MAEPHCRWMIRTDLEQVLHIEKQSYAWAWSEDDFLRVMRCRNVIQFVCEVNDRVVGFMIYELHPTKIHVLNLAVAPAARGVGYGCELIRTLKRKARSHRRNRITIAISERNLNGQRWLAQRGFTAERVLRNYYDGTSGDDAYLMSLTLPQEGD